MSTSSNNCTQVLEAELERQERQRRWRRIDRLKELCATDVCWTKAACGGAMCDRAGWERCRKLMKIARKKCEGLACERVVQKYVAKDL